MRESYGLFEGNQWGLDPDALMLAWVAQESSWDPFAVRFEPAFFRRYVKPHLADPIIRREAVERATSFGLLQLMGQTAREIGFTRPLADLWEPELNLYWCCKYLLEDRRRRTDGTWAGALAAYNGGLGGNTRPPYRRQPYIDKIVTRARRIDG